MANSTTCHIYVMWAELGQSHKFYMCQPFQTYIVTTGNCMGTNNVFKWNGALGFVFSTQSPVYGAITVAYSLPGHSLL